MNYKTKSFKILPEHSADRKRVQQWLNKQDHDGYDLVFQTQSQLNDVTVITFTMKAR